MTTAAYLSPGPLGGAVIRRVIALFRRAQVVLPLNSHILIAVSGGADSVALAHLFVHYGRKIVPKEKIHFLHVNHGWRGVESQKDEDFVRALAKTWDVPVYVHQVVAPQKTQMSWEDFARQQRKEVFEVESQRLGAMVLTAHHADDLAETLLWRLFTGAWETHRAGILFQTEQQMRPLLSIRKNEVLQYLQECKQEFREDATNAEFRFQRARMRQSLMPVIEELFPKGMEHLIQIALDAQLGARSADARIESFGLKDRLDQFLFQPNGVRVRRAQWQLLLQQEVSEKSSGEVQLPGGWKLTRQNIPGSSSGTSVLKKWILEQTEVL